MATFKRVPGLFFWLILLVVGLVVGVIQFLPSSKDGTIPGDLVINEFLASNGSGLTDEDGDYSGWVELYNRSSRPVNLSGWALTDDLTRPAKWPLPDMSLESHQYLVIFASGKDRRSLGADSPLHTNFRLNKAGGPLALYNVQDARFVDLLQPGYPEQFRDIAYGRYPAGAGSEVQALAFGYLLNPTPGQPNDETSFRTGIAAEATSSPVEPGSQLRITEIMYNPQGGGSYEFIELKNVGQEELNLADLYFEGIRYTFPASTGPLPPGEFVLLARDPSAFTERYPGVTIDGLYNGQLSNGGEIIAIKDRYGHPILTVEYSDANSWPLEADGQGYSLVPVNLNGDPNDPNNWQSSTNPHGSPGADDPVTLGR